MKKIFILPMLIVPIVAHATGPSAVGQGQTAVVATANAPYATATDQTGDSTTVVSASYVKGAYNDAISAINKVANDVSDLNNFVNNDIEDEIADKQAKLYNSQGVEISDSIIDGDTMAEYAYGNIQNPTDWDHKLVTADALLLMKSAGYVRAVATWGSNAESSINIRLPREY